jgi:hypothetical protein
LIRLAGTPTEKWPRSFAIDPAGNYLIAAGQQSDTISCLPHRRRRCPAARRPGADRQRRELGRDRSPVAGDS